MKETLAQAMARLDDLAQNLTDVGTLTAVIPATVDYNTIRSAIYEVASAHKRHVGDISWSIQNNTDAKILVGLGVSDVVYRERFLGEKKR